MRSIDFTHPLYLHPSDTSGTVLVSHQLTGIENYNLWSRSIRIALLTKNKLGFIDGDCTRGDFGELLQSQWDRCNAIVLSWILNTVSVDLSAGLVFAYTAAHVWNDLKEQFSKVDGSRIFFLHREIALFTQGDSSVFAYYSHLKLIWDEYNALVHASSCNYADFLLDPLPSVNQAYTMVVQEESQRGFSSGFSPLSDTVAMYSNFANSLRGRFNGVCDFCKICGHKRDQCYRLNGFPLDFKFTKTKKTSSAMVANSDQVVNSSESSPLAPMLTSDQYNRLLELLNKYIHDSGDTAVANFAGMVHDGLPAPMNNSVTWILDTGATDHMLFNFECLSNPVECFSRFVHLPNGKTLPITHIGSFWFDSSHCLQNVLYVPDLYNGKMLGIGRKHGGLYVLHSFGSFLSTVSKAPNVSLAITPHCMSSVDNKTSVWHARLAKQTRLPFPISQSRSNLPFQLIHMDLWGPYRISTHSGHSDNGSEFFSKDCSFLFSSLGIVHQSSCVDTPQQNGAAERNHKHLLEVARALRFQSRVHIKFWGECVLAACYLINRLHSAVLNWNSPYEMFHHKPPSLLHLKVFGCLGYATQTKPPDKFAPRAIPSVFMGYSDTQKVAISVISFTTFVSDSEFFVTDLPHSDVSPSSVSQQSASSSSFNNLCPVVIGTESPTLVTSPSSSGLVPVGHVVRKSSRVSKPPLWLNEYVSCQSSTYSFHPISNNISYSHLPSHTQSFLSSISIVEPTTYNDAVKDPLWVNAMQEEIQALALNNTWCVVPLPPRKVPIGYNQREGVDFVETFSPIAKLVTVRTVLALASLQHWSLFQMDVYNAFLQGNLLEEVYMQLPQGFYSQGENMVCRLQKSIYGLKQASRQWNMRLTEALVTAGYVQSKFDYSLFTKRKGTKIVIMLIYVDDLLITGNDAAMIEELKKILHASFRMKDLGELKYFLGFEILRSREGILLNQRKYALELIEETRLGGAKPVCTPMEQNIKLTTAGYDSSLIENDGKKIDDEVLQGEKEIYQRLIGRLIYLTHTRPDITFVVHHLSQFMQQPKRSHLEAALRVVKYIKKNPGRGILLSST
ncbi:hypothetical protein F3Y22_tig00009003pilonHSYRG00075 [Hibiscus syriacus]|uniref:Integrase catalytic domain-containing protein n=1 Tax=Hibiscus syriacus TaxID=106335 RepID=A0A6A3C964_HIBSY|nr:hypothetical protein F3Y22_tig00009003pilonHSYRG00075 [Hibiscus syriacus]